MLGIIFSSVGLLLFFYEGTSLLEIPLFMTSTMPLLSFLTVLPWMTSVVYAGRFHLRLNDLLNKDVSDLGKFYPRSSFTAYIFTTFMNLSALTLSQEVLNENMKNLSRKIKEAFISRTTLRAFACAQAWSPMEIIVAITVDSTGVPFFSYLPWLLLCSLVVISLDWLFGKRQFTSIPYEPAEKTATHHAGMRKIAMEIVKLFVALFLFLIIVVTIGNYFHLDFILSVTFVIIPFSIIWAMVLRRRKSFWVIGWNEWKRKTNGMQNFVVLFLSLAFFSNSLNETAFNELVQKPFLAYMEYPLIIFIFIQLMFLLMGLIGVHAIATIGVLVAVLEPLYQVVNPISIGIVLITGALATATVGPYGVTITMTAMNTDQNPYRITLRNLPFALFYASVGLLLGVWLL